MECRCSAKCGESCLRDLQRAMLRHVPHLGRPRGTGAICWARAHKRACRRRASRSAPSAAPPCAGKQAVTNNGEARPAKSGFPERLIFWKKTPRHDHRNIEVSDGELRSENVRRSCHLVCSGLRAARSARPDFGRPPPASTSAHASEIRSSSLPGARRMLRAATTRNGTSIRVIDQKLHCQANASPSSVPGQRPPRPYFVARYRSIAINSQSTNSPSRIDGIRPLGLMARYSGVFQNGSRNPSECGF